jgi:N-acylethanolamine-hydrolysing acid amidase beta subunit-like protein
MPLPDGPIPTYRIDIALPPEQRYVEVARDFAPRMRDVTNVFDELLLSIFRYPLLCRAARFCAKALFRRLYDDEQNREVRSISKIAAVDLYLVIALNILLDALMSCTAGCILTEPRRSADGVKGSRRGVCGFEAGPRRGRRHLSHVRGFRGHSHSCQASSPDPLKTSVH